MSVVVHTSCAFKISPKPVTEWLQWIWVYLTFTRAYLVLCVGKSHAVYYEICEKWQIWPLDV